MIFSTFLTPFSAPGRVLAGWAPTGYSTRGSLAYMGPMGPYRPGGLRRGQKGVPKMVIFGAQKGVPDLIFLILAVRRVWGHFRLPPFRHQISWFPKCTAPKRGKVHFLRKVDFRICLASFEAIFIQTLENFSFLTYLGFSGFGTGFRRKVLQTDVIRLI